MSGCTGCKARRLRFQIPLRLLQIAAPIAALLALAGCSGVRAFNALVPFDAGSKRIAADVSYGPEDRQKLDIYAPDAETAAPTILFFYGGSWNSGSREDYAFVGRALAAAGFVVAIADYRLVPAVRYPVFLEDGARALAWLTKHAGRYGGDPEDIFVMGHSAGAYNAIMLALDPRLSRQVGLTRQVLRGAIGISGPYDFLPLQVKESQAAFGNWPRLAETQPVNHVGTFAPPVLLVTGDKDDVVEPRNTFALAARLRASALPVEKHVYPGVGHAGTIVSLALPFRGEAPVLADVTRFIREHSAAKH